MSVLVVGTVAFDSVETPTESRDEALGGSAVYFAAAARHLGPVRLVGVVGEDFDRGLLEDLEAGGVELDGLEVVPGETFRWAGRYLDDMNQRETLSTCLGVFEHFEPKVPEEWRGTPFVFLANGAPPIQAQVLDQMTDPVFTLLDTMDLWIDNMPDELRGVIGRVDGIVVNDEEARALTGENSIVNAARAIQGMGPEVVVVKRGEHGALFAVGSELGAVPAFPTGEVVDPTGAGDSFAGGLMGALAQAGNAGADAVRRGVVDGTLLASFTVEGFSTEGLGRVESDLESRRAAFRRFASLG